VSPAVVVLDASTLVDVLLQPGRGRHLETEIDGRAVAVPSHFDAEVASALARLHRNGDLTANEVSVRVATLDSPAFIRYPTAALLGRAWELRDNISMLDGIYVALAEDLDTVVLTTDQRLARTTARVRLLQWDAN
jgi:predicted nucleic acid-binding protein